MKVYLISGLGAGEEVFQNIRLNAPTHFIPWLIPEKSETIQHYAARMAESIDTDEPFCLLGVSFGGIMSQEIAKQFPPQKLFIVSSVKVRSAIPGYMKLFSSLGLTQKIPKRAMQQSNGVTHFLFGAKSQREKDALNEIMQDINPDYLRWALTQIGNWQQSTPPPNLIHLHGTQDFLFPVQTHSPPDHLFPGGHFVVVQKGKEISEVINSYLREG